MLRKVYFLKRLWKPSKITISTKISQREEPFFGELETDGHLHLLFLGGICQLWGQAEKSDQAQVKGFYSEKEKSSQFLVVTQGWNEGKEVLKTHGQFLPREICWLQGTDTKRQSPFRFYNCMVSKGKKLNSEPLKGRIQFPVVVQS